MLNVNVNDVWCDVLQADKVQFLQGIKDIPTKEARNAEMAVFSGQPQDAEAILLQAGLIFRAIMLNVQLFNWDRSVTLHIMTLLFPADRGHLPIGQSMCGVWLPLDVTATDESQYEIWSRYACKDEWRLTIPVSPTLTVGDIHA